MPTPTPTHTHPIGGNFADRIDAGQQLAQALQEYRDRADVVVYGLPRGGIPVAAQVARSLHAPLEVLIVRKLGVPRHEELAFGAIASGDICVLNHEVLNQLPFASEFIEQVVAREKLELERRTRLYCGDHQPAPVANRCAIIVDDGIATGATIKAALQAVRQAGARSVVIAAPIAPIEICPELRQLADQLVILSTPLNFYAVSQIYCDFAQTSDEEVRQILHQAWHPQH